MRRSPVRLMVVGGLAAIAVACSGGVQGPAVQRLSLQVPDLILVGEEQEVILVLIALNARGPTTFSIDPLPPFGSFSGNTVTLHPRHLIDAGEYALHVTATDGVDTVEKTVTLQVQRPHTPPTLGFLFFMTGCPGWTCLDCQPAPGTWVENYAQDADLDEAKLEFEVVPEGQPFSGTPTQVTLFQPTTSSARFHVQLQGLTVGSRYLGRHHAVDATGQASDWVPLCEGRPFDALP